MLSNFIYSFLIKFLDCQKGMPKMKKGIPKMKKVCRK